ncbi:ABC transporter substrate-binding protein [Bradyrhizobium zhanjiangense]|uniref:ABC transporter substrate-binding protein n=2 Tax=Bradyrhizobium zhanjiangense TaxID=1325107 RepID=A0ABY0DCH4_9BRAD|nr:ABC transporter substrate-binding protein [Bradyrhizobium zhanjiangense]
MFDSGRCCLARSPCKPRLTNVDRMRLSGRQTADLDPSRTLGRSFGDPIICSFSLAVSPQSARLWTRRAFLPWCSMRRREFMGLIGGAAATWPLGARAQQPARSVYRVGYLASASREQTFRNVGAFEAGLRSLGYRVGENVVIEYRFADGDMGRLAALATEVAGLGVDVIVSGTNATTVAAMKATRTIPIVMANSAEPVSAGLVASLARPGGNVTGFSSEPGDEINGKRLEFLKDILPNLSRVGILWNPDFAPNQDRLTSLREVAQALALTLVPAEARGPDILEQAFATMVGERAQVLLVLSDGVLFNHRGLIGVMAVRNRLPAISAVREYAEAGFLLSYGIDLPDQFRRSATFVDKIFRGAKPGDLPVERPTKYELVINLQTAKALGINMPPAVLTWADVVIE